MKDQARITLVQFTLDDSGQSVFDRLRRLRKHHRMMHQRRPELYGALARDVTMWRDYPDIPWVRPECADLVNRAQL